MMDAKTPGWMRSAFQAPCSPGWEQHNVQRLDNLNGASIDNADAADVAIADERKNLPRVFSDVEVIFKDLEHHLSREIAAADVVVGCMAWLTNEKILKCLAQKEMVSVLVQKEDWLRPDTGKWTPHGLHTLYAALPEADRYSLDAPYNSCADPTLAPVMCVGNCPEHKSPALARMHHKFMVFCRREPVLDDDASVIPYAVWTGSFNATYNGTQSLENAVILRNAEIARAYMDEWRTILGIAECLDWQHRWVAPEFRIGT